MPRPDNIFDLHAFDPYPKTGRTRVPRGHVWRYPVEDGDRLILPLTKNRFMLMSPEDADLGEDLLWHWAACLGPDGKGQIAGYGRRTGRTPTGEFAAVYFHRFVMERMIGRPLSPDEKVDHENGDSLDSRRENLRIIPHAVNVFLARAWSHSTTGVRGVYYSKAQTQRPWHAKFPDFPARSFTAIDDAIAYWHECWKAHPLFSTYYPAG